MKHIWFVLVFIVGIGLGYCWHYKQEQNFASINSFGDVQYLGSNGEMLQLQSHLADQIKKDFTLTIFNGNIVVYTPKDCITQWVSSGEDAIGIRAEFLIDPNDVQKFKPDDKIPIIISVPEGALWFTKE
jgi:hypothetical protein